MAKKLLINSAHRIRAVTNRKVMGGLALPVAVVGTWDLSPDKKDNIKATPVYVLRETELKQYGGNFEIDDTNVIPVYDDGVTRDTMGGHAIPVLDTLHRLPASSLLLDDEFLDVKNAGTINNTPATPGPGTRLMKDVAGVNATINPTFGLVITGATADATGDPAYNLSNVMARTPGRMMAFRYTVDAIGPVLVGFHTSTGVYPRDVAFYFTGGYVLCYQTPMYHMNSIAVGDIYEGIAIQRTNGGFLFGRKNGGYVYLEGIQEIANGASAYVSASDYTAGGGKGKFRFFRVPVATWLPAPILSDGFPNLMDGRNGGFETAGAGGADVFAQWSEYTTGASTVVRDTTIFYGGVASCKLTSDGAGNGSEVDSVGNMGIINGSTYRFSFMARGDGHKFWIYLWNGTSAQNVAINVTPTANWTRYSYDITVTNGNGSYGYNILCMAQYSSIVSKSIWFDDVSVTALPLASDGKGHAEGVAGGLGSGGASTPEICNTAYNLNGRSYNNPTLGAEKVTDGDMELVGVTNWAAYGTPTTRAKSGVQYHGGTQSIHIVTNATFEGAQQTLTAPVGDWLLIDGWVYVVTNLGFVGNYANEVFPACQAFTATTGAWIRLISSGRVVTADPKIYLSGHTLSGSDFYTDDVSVKKLTLSDCMRLSQFSTPDVLIRAELTRDLTTSITSTGFAINVDNLANPRNFILVYTDGIYLYIDKCINGTYTNLGNNSITYGAGKYLMVTKQGSKYAVYYDNTLIGAFYTISDAEIVSNKYHGTFQTSDTWSIDNLLIYAEGSSNEYNNLLGLVQ